MAGAWTGTGRCKTSLCHHFGQGPSSYSLKCAKGLRPCRKQTSGDSSMAKTQVGGISGVLGELISKEPEGTEPEPKKQPRASRQKADATGTPSGPCRARLGRPPGSTSRQAGPKEKVTLRIPSDLIAEYRDWSWEARCQISELVEKALTAYRALHRRS